MQISLPRSLPPTRGRRHGGDVTDEVRAVSSTRRCPPHQSPPATASPHRGSLWRFRKSCKRLICSANQRLRYSIFFCFSKRKRWQKKMSPGGFRFPPGAPLNRPEKPLRFFWTFPAIAENPMRIRTTLWTFSAGYFAAVIQTQLLTNPLFRIRRRAAETRRVSLGWNAKLKSWFLPKFRGRKHQT